MRVSSLGREVFLGSGAGFGSTFFFTGVAVLAAPPKKDPEGLGVGGVFGRELDFLSDLEDFSAFAAFSALSDFDDFSVFSDFDVFSDFSALEGFSDFEGATGFDAVAVLDDDFDFDFDGVGGVVVAGGDVLVLSEAKGLGHAPMAFGVSSTTGAASFFDLASALDVFAGVLGSGVAFVAAAAFSGAPLLPVATGGGGAVSGIAASPNNCRARSFTLGNMVWENLGLYDSGRIYACWNTTC